MLGKKLTTPINSLGTKLVKGINMRHNIQEHREPKEHKSYLEKR